MTTTLEKRLTPETCFLYEAAGRTVLCDWKRCPFWDGGCTLVRFGLRGQSETQPELAAWLLAIRSELSAKTYELPDEPLPPYNLLPLPGFRR
jgi:hypothetical protein